MNLTKQQMTIIGVIIALIAIWYFFLRKKPTESGYKTCNTGATARECPRGQWCVAGKCQDKTRTQL